MFGPQDQVFTGIDGNPVSLEGQLRSLDTKMTAALEETRGTRAAVSSLFATEFEDPSEPGKFYKFADFVVWGATNAKLAAGNSGKPVQSIDPVLLAEAMAQASTSVTAEKVAELLQVNVTTKEGAPA